MSGDVMSAWGEVASTWQVTVDSARCTGSGICAGTAAPFFRLDGGLSTVVQEVNHPDMRLLDAALSCPRGAITVQEVSTGVMLAGD